MQVTSVTTAWTQGFKLLRQHESHDSDELHNRMCLVRRQTEYQDEEETSFG